MDAIKYFTIVPQHTLPTCVGVLLAGRLVTTVVFVLAGITVLLGPRWVFFRRNPYRHLPLLNPPARTDLFSHAAVADFQANSKKILEDGRRKYPHEPYRLVTDLGEVVMVPPEFVEELKSHPKLDFLTPALEDSHSYIPGFEPFGANEGINRVVNKYLTRALITLTTTISVEASQAVRDVLTDSTDWHIVKAYESIMAIVGRMSSRIFLGPDLCRDDDWLQASASYIQSAISLTAPLNAYPLWLRRYVHWVLPGFRDLRRLLQLCRRLLQPHIERRNSIRDQHVARGEPSPFNDSIEWFDREYASGHDPAVSQVTLTILAVHMTTDLLVQTLVDLARHPELLAPLRKELVGVLRQHGLTKAALHNLKRMDSVLKESQRLKPVILGFFRRLALEDIRMSNGFVIKKGTKIMTDATHMWSETHYDQADQYDGFRWFRMRGQPGLENKAHLVSTSSNHLGFGHGAHACPGRFFASNELKIALAHLLLKYDWELPEGTNPQPKPAGFGMGGDPDTLFRIRRRVPEINLEELAGDAVGGA